MQTRNFSAEIKKKFIVLIFVMISSRFEVKEVFTRQVTLTPISIQRATLAAPIVGFTISMWVIPTTINCCLILPTNPQYFSSLIFKNVATNLSFEYAWFLSNFGLNVSKFRIRQSSDYWVEKSQVALLFSIASI